LEFRWEPFGRTHRDEPQAAPVPRKPAHRLAVLTCMDCRIDPLEAFGLALGDAVVLRNGGAEVSDDVLRSLRLARDNLGVAAVRVVGHTDCAAHGSDDAVAAAEVERSVVRIGEALPELEVRGAMLDLGTGRLFSA
jgi:carbonic anhydrase